MRYYVTIGAATDTVEAEITQPNECRVVHVDEQGNPKGAPQYVRLDAAGPTLIATLAGRRFWVNQGSTGDRLELTSRTERTHASVSSGRERTLERLRRAKSKRAGAESITAPMPGRIVGVLVAEGERVEAGQPLIRIEAMKMQNELLAEHAGIVGRISVRPGDSVEAGIELVRLAGVASAPGDD